MGAVGGLELLLGGGRAIVGGREVRGELRDGALGGGAAFLHAGDGRHDLVGVGLAGRGSEGRELVLVHDVPRGGGATGAGVRAWGSGGEGASARDSVRHRADVIGEPSAHGLGAEEGARLEREDLRGVERP